MSSPLLTMHVREARYADRVALRDVALEVRRGEIVGVCGHVGAGKSTLALAAAGLLTAAGATRFEASVRRDGGDASKGMPAAMVFASPWTQLTGLGESVREEVAIGPENQGVPTNDLRRRVEEALARAGVSHLANRDPRELSGGELQRVAVASALSLNASLLVLDEPTSQLDRSGVDQFRHLLPDLAGSGHGILLVEQDLELLGAVCHRVIVLADGRELANGDPAELLERWPPLDARLGAPPRVRERHEQAAGRTLKGRGLEAAPLLTVRGLRVRYELAGDVLQGLSLDVPAGSATAWMGPNGAGKTTLARAIMGLVSAEEGTIAVHGITLDQLPTEARARHVGLVFQDPSRQLFATSVADEVAFGPRALGESPARARQLAREALELVGLEAEQDSHPGDLSLQARRRLSIAAAMASRPPLLLLDEPTAGQDEEGRSHIARAIAEQRERGAAVVITHDAEFARRYCDMVQRIDRAGGARH